MPETWRIISYIRSVVMIHNGIINFVGYRRPWIVIHRVIIIIIR